MQERRRQSGDQLVSLADHQLLTGGRADVEPRQNLRQVGSVLVLVRVDAPSVPAADSVVTLPTRRGIGTVSEVNEYRKDICLCGFMVEIDMVMGIHSKRGFGWIWIKLCFSQMDMGGWY